MNNKKIEDGSLVYIKWQDKNGSWLPPEQVMVLNMPKNEGDLLQIQYAHGMVQAFSPTRTDYVLET